MPFMAEIVFADIMARLDAQKLPKDLKVNLTQLVSFLKIRLPIDKLIENIAHIQNYQPKYYDIYIDLAIQALMKLDFEQFIHYSQMAAQVRVAA